MILQGARSHPEWFSHQSNSFEDTPMIRNALSLAALSILLLTAAGQPGWAASFDCAKAETADEKGFA